MKRFSTTLLFLFCTIFANAQIKGNANHRTDISRQNVAQSKMGNAMIHGNPQRLINHRLTPNDVITIDVKALHNVVADSYTAIFNVVQIGETSEETNKLMSERVNKVKSALVSFGIPSANIVNDVISFVPVYETVVEKKLFSKKYNEVPKGFELQQNLHIKFTNVSQFEKILTACANNEIYNLVKVDYFVKDMQAVYRKLRAEILKVLKEKQAFNTALGFDLANYNPKMADNKYCYMPRDFYKHYQAFNSISFDAIKRNRVVNEIKKQTSYYYDPLRYDNYDVVINPEIVEPVVQIGMEIKIQYYPKPEEEQEPIEKEVIKNKYFMISTDGKVEVKELKLES